MRRYPSLNYPAEVDGLAAEGTVYAQEKLDGANFRFMRAKHVDGVERDGLVFGSRNVVWKNEKDVAKAFDDHPETGESALDYVRYNIDMEALKASEESTPIVTEDGTERSKFVVYGEAMHPHTLDYNWQETPRVVLYDVYDLELERYMSPHAFKAFCRTVGLPWSPFVDEVPAEQFGEIDVPQSAYRDGKAEGVVLKNFDTGARSKLVTEDFQEKFDGPSPSQNNVTDTDIVVDRFITEARIAKMAHYLVDEGGWDSLQMKMMEDLPEAVIRDAMQEEAGNIVMENNYEIDTGELRSKASTKCARTLRSMLQ